MTYYNNNNSNNNSDCHHQHYLSESSSPSLTDPNYLQNQGSNLDTTRGNEKQRNNHNHNHNLSKGYLSWMTILIYINFQSGFRRLSL